MAFKNSAQKLCSRFDWVVIALLLLLVGFVVHIEALHLPLFANESLKLSTNPAYQSFASFFSRYKDFKSIFHRPLSGLVFAGSYQFFGTSPFPHYAFNLILHLLNGVLLYFWMNIRAARRPWLASLIFIVHPLSLGGVAQLFGRPYLLGATFMLLCLIIYELNAKERLKFLPALAWGSLAFICSILVKQTYVFIPILIFWFSFKDQQLKKIPKKILWSLSGSSILLGLAFIIFYALPYSLTAKVNSETFFLSQILHFPRLLGLYFWPTFMTVSLPLEFYSDNFLSLIPGGILFLIFLGLIFYFRHLTLSVWLGAILIAILPTNSFLPKTEVILIWRLYPSLIFFAAFIAYCFNHFLLLGNIPSKLIHYKKPLQISLFICLMLYVGMLSYVVRRQEVIYKDEYLTYKQIAESYPQQVMGYYGMAAKLISKGELKQAQELLYKCLELDPNHIGSLMRLEQLRLQLKTKS